MEIVKTCLLTPITSNPYERNSTFHMNIVAANMTYVNVVVTINININTNININMVTIYKIHRPQIHKL